MKKYNPDDDPNEQAFLREAPHLRECFPHPNTHVAIREGEVIDVAPSYDDLVQRLPPKGPYDPARMIRHLHNEQVIRTSWSTAEAMGLPLAFTKPV